MDFLDLHKENIKLRTEIGTLTALRKHRERELDEISTRVEQLEQCKTFWHEAALEYKEKAEKFEKSNKLKGVVIEKLAEYLDQPVTIQL